MHEILILQVELRVSATLLPELQRKKKILLDTVEVQCSRDWYGPRCKSDLASRKPIRTLSALFLAKRPFHTKILYYDREEVERYTFQFTVWKNFVNSRFRNDLKNDTSLRSRWNTTWRSVALRHDKKSITESFRRTWIIRFVENHCLRLIRQGSS